MATKVLKQRSRVPILKPRSMPDRVITSGSSGTVREIFQKAQHELKETRFYLELIGLEALETHQILNMIEAGFGYESLERLQRYTGLPLQEIADSVQIPATTLNRRKKEGRLNREESDRLLRISRIFGLAIALFEGDYPAAHRWLNSPQKALEGETPLDTAKTEFGSRMVENLIGRLEHGVFT